jgi:hypothetical protein
VGDPINCIHSKDLPHDVINAFCWVHSTFSIESAFTKRVDIDISYPGVENSLGGKKAKKEHRYYQWVIFCLFLQVSVWFGLFVFLLAGWDFWYCGHYWPIIVPALNDR